VGLNTEGFAFCDEVKKRKRLEGEKRGRPKNEYFSEGK
jgi:hypothetical protein